MFGFLRPRNQSDEYRRAYARLCVHQRQRYGLRSLPFHSFEAVLLYQLAVDCGAVDAATLPNVRCCKLSLRDDATRAVDSTAGHFCASFALLLASVKIDDDIRDSRSILARFAKRILNRRIRQAKQHLRSFDPAFDATVAEFLARHHRLESSGAAIELREYTRPTADAFGYLFGLFSAALGRPELSGAFVAIGERVGRAIIAFDCGADWHRDRARGEFNPLPDEAAVERSLEFCWQELGELADECRAELGHRSSAARTASGVAERIGHFRPHLACAAPGYWRLAKRVIARNWPSLTADRLAFAGLPRNSGEPEEKPTDTAEPPPARGWRRRTVDAMQPGDRPMDAPAKSKSDCGDGICAASCCAVEGGDCCCALLACL